MTADVNLLTGRRILVVEDEYFIAEEMVNAFETAGAEVVGPVASIAEALELMDRQQEIDGAVLDINLHGEMVYPLADTLQIRGVPIVFTTGYDDVTIPDWYKGAKRCEKPAEIAAIAEALFGPRNT